MHSQRTARPLLRERLAVGAFALALVPPAIELVRFVSNWQP